MRSAPLPRRTVTLAVAISFAGLVAAALAAPSLAGQDGQGGARDPFSGTFANEELALPRPTLRRRSVHDHGGVRQVQVVRSGGHQATKQSCGVCATCASLDFSSCAWCFRWREPLILASALGMGPAPLPEHRTSNPRVAGSTPAGRTSTIATATSLAPPPAVPGQPLR